MSQAPRTERFVLISVVSPFVGHDEALKDLEELKSLVQTFGGATVVRVIQRRMKPDVATYIGSGKADEVADIIRNERVDVVVLNAIMKPSQLFNLEKIFWQVNPLIQVWDRIDLILHIFSKHAHTAEAKLQIELAMMRHMGPKIYGMGMVMSRQGGGVGTRGLGETNTELMKRHWRNEMKAVQLKLEKLQSDRQRQLQRRRDLGLKTVSIVGYTNAGKSTLFNLLTGKKKKAQDVLFATLDSSVAKLYLPSTKADIVVSDTIGFIQNLPAKLIDAFKSTLMESVNADLLLHVIDMSDPLINEKIMTVESVLADLGIGDKPKLYVFNKLDKTNLSDLGDLAEAYAEFNPQFVSSHTEAGMEGLREAIAEVFNAR